MVEAVVTLGTAEVSMTDVPGVRPGLLFEESFAAIVACQENAQWQAAMRRRGIEDLETVQIDPWPAGSFGVAHEEGRRICRCLSYVRHTPDDNGYAHPVEGVVVFVDMARGEVLEVIDTGIVPIPPECGNYFPESTPVRQDLKPLEITQPEGPSFVVDGNHVRWQKWSLRVSMDSVEGLVLHEVGYEDQGRVRPILFRASVSEMVVPYGDPGPMHGWKNAFDAGEWGLGRMANSLALGCDCLGVIHYFDAVLSSERGHPYVVPKAICMHEEDYGILWKHNDPRGGRNDVRRSRRLVVSSIATVGNYDYGFFWYFYQDGTIQFEVKLTGILSTMAVAPGEQPRFASMVAPQLAAPFHQHLFNVRLDAEIDGPANSVYEVDTHPVAPGPRQPVGQRLRARGDAARDRDRRPSGRGPLDQPALEDRQPRLGEPPRDPRRLQARPGIDTHAARRPGLERGPASRVRHAQPLGHSLRPRRAPGRGRLSQPARRRGRAPEVDGAGPVHRREGHRGLVHLRRHPRPPARGLARDAGRVRGVHVDPRGVLRPQPRPRRAGASRRLPPRVGQAGTPSTATGSLPGPCPKAARSTSIRLSTHVATAATTALAVARSAAVSRGRTRTWPLWGHTPTTRQGTA